MAISWPIFDNQTTILPNLQAIFMPVHLQEGYLQLKHVAVAVPAIAAVAVPPPHHCHYKARHAHKCLCMVLPIYSKIQVLPGITSCRLMKYNNQQLI